MTASDPNHDGRSPPARLSRLSISGFRSIAELDLELRPLTVLIGSNGSGKSNLIAFFNLLSALISGRLEAYVASRGGASSILHYGPKITPSLRGQLVFDDAAMYEFVLSFAMGDRLIVEDSAGSAGALSHERLTFTLDQSESNLRHVAALPDAPAGLTTQLLRRLEALRVYHFHDTSESARIRVTQDVGDNRYLRQHGDNLAAFLYMLRRDRPNHYENILSTVRLAVPFLQDFVLEPDPFRPSIQLRWRDHSVDGEFGPHQLSDGSLRAIALITALLQPEELMPSLFIIDEPELGLHPAAIATVAQLIQAVSLKRQVIIATQSSRLIAGFAPEDVVVVERDIDDRGHGSSTFQRLSKEALGGWLEDYDLGQLYDMGVTGGGPQ